MIPVGSDDFVGFCTDIPLEQEAKRWLGGV